MKDAFYNAKLNILTKKFVEKGMDVSSAYKSAEKELNLQYDKKGRYLGEYVETLDEKLVRLVSQANFHYKNAIQELFKLGEVLDEIKEVKDYFFDGLEMARKEGYYGYFEGKFHKGGE